MSRFTGSPEERWPLAAALDDLFESVRRAARPSWIWVAGLLYPALWSGAELLVGGATQDVALLPVVGILLLALYSRLNAGLARLSPVAVWDRVTEEIGRPGLLDCWRAGRGMTLSVLGMHLSLLVLRWGLILLMFLPAVFAWEVFGDPGDDDPGTVLLALISLPALAVLALYNVLLSLLLQVGLHSLVHNRRGVGSALQHAWSILRHDVWASGRAFAGELVLALTLGLASTLVYAAAEDNPFGIALALGALCLDGIAGVSRAGFWARAYRALGGLSPDDGVPGLDPELFGPSAAASASASGAGAGAALGEKEPPAGEAEPGEGGW